MDTHAQNHTWRSLANSNAALHYAMLQWLGKHVITFEITHDDNNNDNRQNKLTSRDCQRPRLVRLRLVRLRLMRLRLKGLRPRLMRPRLIRLRLIRLRPKLIRLRSTLMRLRLMRLRLI